VPRLMSQSHEVAKGRNMHDGCLMHRPRFSVVLGRVWTGELRTVLPIHHGKLAYLLRTLLRLRLAG
jgi:hypothetical protein